MGRSVDYLSNANTVCYEDVSWMGMEKRCECEELNPHDAVICEGCEADIRNIEPTYNEGHTDFDWWIEDIIIYRFTNKYPSLESVDRWDGRETKIILENNLIEVGVSEYCGLASISMRAKEDDYDGRIDNLANRMADYVGEWMNDNIGDIVKQGAFSNGEGVYKKKD